MVREYNQTTTKKTRAGKGQDGQKQKESVLKKSANKAMSGIQKSTKKTKAVKDQDGQQQKESVSKKSANKAMSGIHKTTEKTKAGKDQDGQQQKESVSKKSANKAMSGIQITTEKNKAGRDQYGQQKGESVSEKSANEAMFGSINLEGKHLPPGCPNPIPLKVVKRSMSGNLSPGSYFVGGSAPGWNFIIYDGTDRPLVGESPSGWNFITYGYKKPRYYGVTKKAFMKKRKSRPS